MIRPVRGMADLMPDPCRRVRALMAKARQLADAYGFEEIATPLVEYREVFDRTAQTSDIVSKEMFTVLPRGDGDGESSPLVLRPEGTAPLMRAVIAEGLTQQWPLKFFYAGPMFRYDRPQKGRLRQFHQVGVECLGEASPYTDVDTIACGVAFLKALGVWEKTCLELNTLGDILTRQRHTEALVAYLTPLRDQLSPESQERLRKNPLRIFDSKSPADQDIMQGAPQIQDYLTPESQDFFEAVCQGLQGLGIPYRVNPRLVRGLDYYGHTTFEVTTTALGAQGTVLAGGRYDGLSSLLGGPPLPGVGWAAGVERLDLLQEAPLPLPRGILILPHGPSDAPDCLVLAELLRHTYGLSVSVLHAPAALGKRLTKADKGGWRHILILGDAEREAGSVIWKDLKEGTQRVVLTCEIGPHLTLTCERPQL